MEEKIVSFVTGANGFVGSHLVDYLLELGQEVHAIVRPTSNLQWLEGKAVVLHRCGLGEVPPLREALQDAHYIYHIAGVVKVPTEADFMRGNVTMTEHVLEAAKDLATLRRVLVVSSMAATGYAPMGGAVDEEDPLRPIEPYGNSKVAQEAAAWRYAEQGVPITIVRPPGVYGPRDTEIFTFFKAIQGGISAIMGMTPKEMSLIHVRDLVQGMYLAATEVVALNQVYFLGSTERYNWKQLGEVASKVMDKRTITLRIPHFIIFFLGFLGQIAERLGMDVALNRDRAYRITRPSWYCSSEKAVQQLGFRQTVSIEEGFRQTVEWYRAHDWL